MIAITYPRVSTEEQARHGYSLASQSEACRKRAYELGYTDATIIEIVEDGVSGDILERPGLTKVRALAAQGGVGHLICLDPDRFSRKLVYQLIVTEELEKAGVQLEFISFEWKDTPEGRLFYSLRGAVAEFEKAKILERTSRGRRQKALQGELTHPCNPYGYDYVAPGLQINETEAAWVRQAYAWCGQENLGPTTIAWRLDQAGARTRHGGPWRTTVVRQMLANTAYRGEMVLQKWQTDGVRSNRYRDPAHKVHKGLHPEEHWVRIAVPAIVDDDLWEAAQISLAGSRRRNPGTALSPYLLSGLCVCGECGRPMAGGRTQHWRYYRCLNTVPHHRVHVRADALEAEVWVMAREWLLHPETLLAEVNREATAADQNSAASSEVEAVIGELARLDQERDRLLTLYQKGVAPADKLEERLADLAGKERRLRERMVALSGPRRMIVRLPSPSKLEKVLSASAAILDQAGPAERQALTRLVVDRVVLSPGQRPRSYRLQVSARIPSELLVLER